MVASLAEVSVWMEKGVLHGKAKINMRDLGVTKSAASAEDFVFESLLQPERGQPSPDGTPVQWSRPRKVCNAPLFSSEHGWRSESYN